MAIAHKIESQDDVTRTELVVGEVCDVILSRRDPGGSWLLDLLEAPNDEHGWLDTVAVSTALPPKVADSILDRARIF